MKIVNDCEVFAGRINELNYVCDLIPKSMTDDARELLESEVPECWGMFEEELPELLGVYVFEDECPDAFLLEDGDGAFFVVSSGLLDTERTVVRIILMEAITAALNYGLETPESVMRDKSKDE